MKLNEKQEEVASYKDGSCLCIAGAGSGKTRSLIARVVNKKIDVKSNILQLAFSKSANFQKPLLSLIDDYTNDEKKIILAIYQDFIQFKKEKVLLDYDDLLLEFRKLLQNPKIQKRVSKQYHYVMVDEYQDTNVIQSDIVKLLTPHGNIMVVGDDAQCVDSLTEVETDQGIKLVKDLKENDRILSYRNGIIKFQTVAKIWESNWKFGFKVTTKSGKTLTMSPTHKIWASDPILKRGVIHVVMENKYSYVKLEWIDNKFDEFFKDMRVHNNRKILKKHNQSYKQVLQWAYDIAQKTNLRIVERLHVGHRYFFTLKTASLLLVGKSILSLNDDKTNIIIDEIVSIEKVPGEFFDIEVDDSCNFFGNGILSHNSIYGFRGACYQNIISFPGLFENTEIVKLEENYRSIQKILELANRVFISKYDKNLFSKRVDGEKPFFKALPDDETQTRYVADNVQYYLSQGIPAKEIAILYRVNFHANFIEEEFVQRGIKYNKAGGLSFIEKAHIRDVLSFFKVIYNTNDDVSWSRVLCLFDNVGTNTAYKIIQQIRTDSLDLQLIKKIDRKVLAEFIYWVHNDASDMKLDVLIDSIIEKYMVLCEKNYKNSEDRKEDLDFFIKLATRYKSLESLIVGMSLEAEFSDNKDEEDAVVLSTIHSAKGLEWTVVIIINVCEGSIPFYLSKKHEEIEEEKRLLYVAVTRAKKHLHLTMAEQQIRCGYTFKNKPSHFITGLKDFLK